MMTRLQAVAAGLAFAALAISDMHGTTAAAVEGLDPDARAALAKLYETMPAAKVLGEQAKGILVFPSVGRAGFLVGVQYGEGVSSRATRSLGTTTSRARPTASRPARRCSRTRCSS
jgi:lipid-binding SYLF domain-containing protein